MDRFFRFIIQVSAQAYGTNLDINCGTDEEAYIMNNSGCN